MKALHCHSPPPWLKALQRPSPPPQLKAPLHSPPPFPGPRPDLWPAAHIIIIASGASYLVCSMPALSLSLSLSLSIYIYTRNATALGSLIRPRAVTRCNLAVSDMYMRDFGKTHQIAYTYCSVGISDLKPLTGTSADQLPHRKSQSLATA